MTQEELNLRYERRKRGRSHPFSIKMSPEMRELRRLAKQADYYNFENYKLGER
jgi:hypothetical protein